MCDEFLDGDDLQVVPLGNLQQSLAARPITVLVQNLTEHPGRGQSRHASQVDGGFGMAGPSQHTTLFGQQQMHVPGAHEVLGTGLGVRNRPDRHRTFFGGDPGPHAGVVQGRHKGRPERRRIGLHQWPHFESSTGVGQHRHAELTPATHHEIDHIRRRLLGSANEVSLVLSVFRVHHNHYFPAAMASTAAWTDENLRATVTLLAPQPGQRSNATKVGSLTTCRRQTRIIVGPAPHVPGTPRFVRTAQR